MTERPPLSKGEFEIARAIWQLGEATVGQVYESFSEKKKIDYSTVQTYIRRLESKGYLSFRRVGRNKVYSAKVRPGKVIKRAVDDFMNQLFDGELIPLMKHLIDDRGISEIELDQLRAMLDRAEENPDEHDR